MDRSISVGGDAGQAAAAALAMQAGIALEALAPRFRFQVECRDADGNLRWVEDVSNLVTTAGKNDLLGVYFKSGSATATWYVGLIDGSSPTLAAGDTASSHSGWTENTAYSQTLRQTLTLGSVSGGSVDNSASKATYSVNGTGTVSGAFVISVSTKGGTTGTLYGEATFASARSVFSGDTLNVTVTLTA